jgi:hypothetical protein
MNLLTSANQSDLRANGKLANAMKKHEPQCYSDIVALVSNYKNHYLTNSCYTPTWESNHEIEILVYEFLVPARHIG